MEGHHPQTVRGMMPTNVVIVNTCHVKASSISRHSPLQIDSQLRANDVRGFHRPPLSCYSSFTSGAGSLVPTRANINSCASSWCLINMSFSLLSGERTKFPKRFDGFLRSISQTMCLLETKFKECCMTFFSSGLVAKDSMWRY